MAARAGGFYSSPTKGGEESPSKKRGGDKPAQSVTPLTCKQIAGASQPHAEGVFLVDGRELALVTLVGQLREVQEQSTNVVYRVEDGTGTIDVRLWIDGAAALQDETLRSAMSAGTYVRVFGHLRSYQGQRAVIATRVQPVTDWNEITFHILQTAVAHLHATRGPSAASDVGAAPAAVAPMAPVLGAAMFATNAHQMVFELVKANESETGEAVGDIVAKLKSTTPEARIREILQSLANEGYVYTTIDEEHYKAA